jgi:hypothetical protein
VSFFPDSEETAKEDFANELRRDLPKIIRWIPTVIKAGNRRYGRWKVDRKPENRIRLHPVDARIEVRAADQATIHFSIVVANFGSRTCEPDRLALDSVSIGGRNLHRSSDMINVRGEFPPQTLTLLWFPIDFRGSDVVEMIRGISKASNPWSSPQASVRTYGEILFLAGKERFRKPVNFQWDWATSSVMNGLPETLV